MEIPDLPELNYKKIRTQIPVCQPIDFYSIQVSQIEPDIQTHKQNSSYDEQFKVILEEEVEKKTLNISWQIRFFSLTPSRLIYYQDDTKLTLKGCFNFSSLLKYGLSFYQADQKLIFTLSLMEKEGDAKKQPKQILVLNFEQKPERILLWKTKLSETLYRLKNNQKNDSPNISLNQIESANCKLYNDNYWNKMYISPKQLLNYANQLDIVFFKSKAPFASFQRLLMRSNFDHVALLIRDSCNRLLVLEAIESRGVWVNQWSTMLPSFRQHYEQIAFRKLITTKNKIDIEKLENYLDLIIGQKYELSISKLLIADNESTDQDLQANNKNSQKKIPFEGKIKGSLKQKTYFCSQLIADIYIKCGLIRGKKKNEFWPKDLQNNSLKLENATLSPLMYFCL